MITIILLKMFVFDDTHIALWVSVRKMTDSILHRIAGWIRDNVIYVKHTGLLKILSVIYHRFIPFLENQYRKLASALYRLHRKLSHMFEYSKSTTRSVSEHLQHLSEHKKSKEEGEQDSM